MAAQVALNGRMHFREVASEYRSAEEKALDFFRRADISETAETIGARDYSRELATHHQSVEQRALGFFQRAAFSDTLGKIWEIVRRQRIGVMLKLIKVVAIVAAAVLFSQSATFAGLLALAVELGGLLFAAITNAFVWLVYIPLYFVNSQDFASSAVLAIGLAWLGGLSPLVALVVSSIVLIGSRLFERAPVAQARVSELPDAIGKALDSVNLGATIQQAASNAASSVGKISRGLTKAALLPAHIRNPIVA